MVPSTFSIITWTCLFSVLAPSRVAASSTIPSVQPLGTSSGPRMTPGAASSNGFSLPVTPNGSDATEAGTAVVKTGRPEQAATAPRAALSTRAPGDHFRRRREDEDMSILPDPDPPTLWLNSLDSLGCVKQSTAVPGTGVCNGPEAWERATDGSRGVYFVAVGDTGLPSTALSKVVATMAEVCSVVPVSFVSLLGDNFYPTGVSSVDDPKFVSHFEVPFGHPALQRVAFFPVLGNHDYQLSPHAQIQRYFSSCATCKQPQDWNSAQVRWRFPNPWYFSRFVYKNVHRDLSAFPLVSNIGQLQQLQTAATGVDEGTYSLGNSVTVVNIHLDSNILLSSHAIARKQLAFLEAVLRSAAAEADWIFVHQHHPLFTDGTLRRNVKWFQDLLLPLYLRYGVDAIFAGHEHLLSHFELDGPDSVGGTIAQVISGSGSKLHRSFPTCCTPSLQKKCKGHQELCRSSNCAFQRTTSGFALVNLTAKEMRVLYVEASTGEVLHHTVRRSKKNIRMQKTAKYVGVGSVWGAPERPLQPKSGASAYPLISRESIPLELTGSSWPTEDVPLWGHVMIVLFLLLFIVLTCACWGRSSCSLKTSAVPQLRHYSLPSWTLRSEPNEPLDLHEAPTVVGSVRTISVGREIELCPIDMRRPGGPLPAVEASRSCELRRQKDQEEMPLV